MAQIFTFPRQGSPSVAAALVTGAGSGFQKNLGALATALRDCDPSVVVAEPVPQKAAEAVRQGTAHGLNVTSYLGRAENAVYERIGGNAPIIAHVDDVSALGRILSAPAAEQRVILAYLLLLLPSQILLCLRMVFVPSLDAESRRNAARLLECLEPFMRKGGRDAIFGLGGKSGYRLAEPRLRSWISTHLATTFPKVNSGLSPTSAPVEVTTDGRRTMALFICHHPAGFRDPIALANDVSQQLPPTQRGADVAVAELDDRGVRFHFVRTRGTDGRLALARGTAIDALSPSAVADLIRHSDRHEVNRTNAATVTD